MLTKLFELMSLPPASSDYTKLIPNEIWELILDKLKRADILHCRTLSQYWNDIVLSYLKSSKRGRAISPLITLDSDEKFQTFTSLMEGAGVGSVPFSKFNINVFSCSFRIVQNFGIVTGHIVTDCIIQIHSPGFYGLGPTFHPSTEDILTKVVEYNAYAKMAHLLRHCSNIATLRLFEGSIYSYEIYPIFIVLPKYLPNLRTLEIRYYPGCLRVTDYSRRFPPSLKGDDFISAVVRSGRNLENLVFENYGDTCQEEAKIARIIHSTKNLPKVSIHLTGIWCLQIGREVINGRITAALEDNSHKIQSLSMYVHDSEIGGSCTLEQLSKLLSKMSQTLISLSLTFMDYCTRCRRTEGTFKLPQIESLRELTLMFGKFRFRPAVEYTLPLPQNGPFWLGQFPNLRRIKLANSFGQKGIVKGYQSLTVTTLELCPWTDFHGDRLDFTFPNLRTVIFHLPNPRTEANYNAIVPFILKHLPNIEVLHVGLLGCSWESLTGESEQPTHESLLALPSFSSKAQKQSGWRLSFANLKKLKLLSVNTLSDDAVALKAFIYLSKTCNFTVPNLSINCYRQEWQTMHEHLLKYFAMLESLFPGFMYTLRISDQEFTNQNHAIAEKCVSEGINWRILHGREVDYETFRNHGTASSPE